MAKTGKRIYRFTAPLERMDGRFAWNYLEFPHDVKELFGKRGEVRVKCLFNGIAADRALMPAKSGYHILVLSGDLRKQAGIRKPGDPVRVELWLDPEPDRIDLPEELADTLDFIPEMKTAWDEQKPGMQRSMSYWVRSAKANMRGTGCRTVAPFRRRCL